MLQLSIEVVKVKVYSSEVPNLISVAFPNSLRMWDVRNMVNEFANDVVVRNELSKLGENCVVELITTPENEIIGLKIP